MIGIKLCASFFAYVFYRCSSRRALGVAAHAETVTVVITRGQTSESESDLRNLRVPLTHLAVPKCT